MGQKRLGAPQANRHQHLVWGNVKVGFKLALEVIGAERCHLRQFIKADGAHIVIVQVIAYPIETVRRFGRHWRMVSQRAEGINQVEQYPLLRQRIVSVPQAVNQLADLPGALRLPGVQPR